MANAVDLQERPAELLQRLIRFDTTNPPGNERDCIDWTRELLDGLGCETRVVAREPERPNLVARLPGEGRAPALLLQGHVDVVPARGEWRQPPFSGELAEGCVWGRGALDMKGGVAMMLAAFMRAKAEDARPPGDVILCLLADEEEGSDLGAKFLVEEHPELFEGVRYAIGEFGGFTMELAGRRFYPIMVAEKQVCWTRATFRGPAGHGSLPVRDGAVAKLGRLLVALDRGRLPIHLTPVVRSTLKSIAAELPIHTSLLPRALLMPGLANIILGRIGQAAKVLDAILRNTAVPTILRGGEKLNVVPGEASVDLDCRLLPGFGPADLFAELGSLAGAEVELEVLRHDPGAPEPDLGLFDSLSAVLRELDPVARPIPMLLPAVTDGRFFARLGIQTYGFLPMRLPEEMRFMDLVHAEDERIPAESLEFGTRAIGRLLQRFGEAGG